MTWGIETFVRPGGRWRASARKLRTIRTHRSAASPIFPARRMSAASVTVSRSSCACPESTASGLFSSWATPASSDPMVATFSLCSSRSVRSRTVWSSERFCRSSVTYTRPVLRTFRQLLEHGHAVEERHEQIEQDQVGLERAVALEDLARVQRAHEVLIPGGHEHPLEQTDVARLIVDDQDPRGFQVVVADGVAVLLK